MASTEKAKSKAQRHEAILAELRATPAIRIVQLAGIHGVSTETIRRDLDELSAEGLISRTYGGATGTPLSEPLLDDRYRTNQDQRAAMSKAVVPLIKDGDTLMIDAGATTIFVARRLAAEMKGLSVVTTSFGVASALATNPTIRIRVCPGEYDPRDGGVTGPDAISYLSQFRVNHAVIGASRFDAEGPSDFNSGSVWIKRTMIKQAEQAILVLTHDKLDKAAFERICSLDEVSHVVTDQPPSDRLARALRDAKVATHISG
jgi:DeoR/GlpR family transcriptional regulator of sugar metabolism